jgi:hypothetical protein
MPGGAEGVIGRSDNLQKTGERDIESSLTGGMYPDPSVSTQVVNQMTARHDAIAVTQAAGTIAI